MVTGLIDPFYDAWVLMNFVISQTYLCSLIRFPNLSQSLFRHYRSLSEFFTRSLRADCRLISSDCIVSPCDGRVLHCGPVNSDTHLEQVKGVTYSLESFFGPQKTGTETNKPYVESLKQKKEGTGLFHCIIYLAPGDYHRFHSPAQWKPELRRHFHGELLSVSPKVAKWVPGLFSLNERAAYLGSWEHGFFSFTAVGECRITLLSFENECTKIIRLTAKM
jgi:phosphatidylserine decarboxylase